MKKLIVWIAIICIGSFFVGCGKQQVSSNRISSQEFIKFIEKSGLKITTSKQDVQGVLSGNFTILDINGDNVGIYEYRSSQEMEEAAKTIRADASIIGNTTYDWESEPHFYKGGDIIISYIGDNKDIIKKIEKFMGRQFAGDKLSLVNMARY